MLDREKLETLAERVVVGLLLTLIAAAAVLFGGVRSTEFAVLTGLATLAVVAWLARLWIDGAHRFLLHPVLVPIAAFAGYAAWRGVQPDVAVPYLARGELLLVALYAMMFVLVLHNLHSQDTLQIVVHGLVLLGTLLSLYSLLQYLGESSKVLWLTRPVVYFGRSGGTFVNPNHLAGFLVPIVPLAAAQVFVSRARGPVRVFHGYGALMMLIGIALTMSRGGWLATAIVLLLFFTWLLFRRRQLRLVALGILGCLVIGAALFVAFNQKARQRIEHVATPGEADAGFRNYVWSPATRMWRENLWLGVGPAQFDPRFAAYRTPTVQLSPGYVHNEYLNTLVDYGLAGGLLVGTGIAVLVGGILWTRKYVERGSSDLGNKGSNRTAFFLGASLGLLGLGLHSAGEFLLHIPAVGLVGVTLAALLASHIRFATERFWLTPKWWSRLLVTAGGVTLLIFLVPPSWHRAREGRHLNRAAAATAVTPELIADLKAAAALEPGNPRTQYEIGENLRRLSWAGLPGWQAQAREAIQWLENAARLNPHDPMPVMRLGLCWHWLDDKEKSRRAFERAVDLGPNDVRIYNHYGWSLLLQGRVRAARAIFEQTLQWNWWDNWFARRYLTEIDAGKYQERDPAAAPAPAPTPAPAPGKPSAGANTNTNAKPAPAR